MNRAVLARAGALASAAAAVLCAAPVEAQFLLPALDRAQLDQRLRQPTLRLATLGRAGLAFDDENNEINQWDFVRSPVGLLSDRSGTGIDLYADLGDRSAKHTVGGETSEVDRSDGGLVGLQAVGRGKSFAFGLETGLQGVGIGTPLQPGLYQDESVGLKMLRGTFSGRAFGGGFGWGAYLGFGSEKFESERMTRGDDDGEQVLSGGDALESVTPFDITEANSDRTELGLGIGWMTAKWGDATLNWDYTKETIEGANETRKRVYDTDEPRKLGVWTLGVTLRPLDGLTLGGAVGTGGYDALETFRYSQSTGQGSLPIQARGNRLNRDVEGEYLKSRLAWTPGGMPNLLVGGDFNVFYGKEAIAPSDGPEDYNAFLASLTGTGINPGQPVLAETQEVRHWDAGVGIGYLLTEKARLGVEAHRANDAKDGTAVHARTRSTDVRGGLEYTFTPEWQGRVGGWWRGLDQDVFTANNEGVATALTLGAGFRPGAGKYTLDGGVEIMDRSTDYPDPTDGTGSGLRFVLYNRWSFN